MPAAIHSESVNTPFPGFNAWCRLSNTTGIPSESPEIQHFFGRIAAFVVLDDEPAANGVVQQAVIGCEPRQRLFPVAVDTTRMENDFAVRSCFEQIENTGMVGKIAHGTVHHVRVLRVEDGVLSGMHGYADVMLPDKGADIP